MEEGLFRLGALIIDAPVAVEVKGAGFFGTGGAGLR